MTVATIFEQDEERAKIENDFYAEALIDVEADSPGVPEYKYHGIPMKEPIYKTIYRAQDENTALMVRMAELLSKWACRGDQEAIALIHDISAVVPDLA